MAGEDFVQVQLTEFGRALAGDGEITVTSCHHIFVFKKGTVLRATKAFEWPLGLQHQQVDGKDLFELAPEPAAPSLLEKIGAKLSGEKPGAAS